MFLKKSLCTIASAPAGGTHTITEGVKSALAQIAASTIHPSQAEEAASGDVQVDVVLPEPKDGQPAPKNAGGAGRAETSERPKKSRRKKSEGARGPRTDKDVLLDSVLEALPEPKAPGQGRGRRRVTTAALTGTPVSTVTPETPTDD